MSGAVVEMDRYVEQWWLWFAVALFLLIPLDLLTTLIAVSKYGIGVEANPIMQWLLHRGLFAVTLVHLVVVGLVVSMFHVAIQRFQRAPPSYRRILCYVVTLWIGILIASGLLVVTNNVLLVV